MSKVTKIVYMYADGTYMSYVPSVLGKFPVSEYPATDYYEIIEYDYENEMVQLEFDF